jgi:hypothetical protein
MMGSPVILDWFNQCEDRGTSPTVREGSKAHLTEPSLTVGLMPRDEPHAFSPVLDYALHFYLNA